MNCDYCSKLFNPSKKTHRFCCSNCQRYSWTKKNRLKKHKVIKRICEVCGITFTAKLRSPNQRFCSTKCSKAHWVITNLPKRKAISKRYTRRRRAKISQVIEDFSNKEWLNKLASTRGFCPACNNYVGVAKLTLDHILPISKAPIGFIYTIDGVQPLCLRCNSSKSNRMMKPGQKK